MTEKLIDRQEAISLGLKRYYTDLECKVGHLSERYVVNGKCCRCLLEYKRANRSALLANERLKRESDPERLAAYRAGYRRRNARIWETHREAETARKKVWNDKNVERIREQNAKKWIKKRSSEKVRRAEKYAANPKLFRAITRTYKKNNPDFSRSSESLRRARRRNAVPIWLSKEQKQEIRALHKQASELAAATGQKWHVDHIVPLVAKALIAGKLVQVACGLHVPWNMQIISERENCSKSCLMPLFDDMESLAA